MSDTHNDDELFAQASTWYFRLQAEDVTPRERAAFSAWIEQGLAQQQAWEQVQALLGALREPARNLHEQQRQARPVRWQRWAVAATVLLGTFLGLSQTPALDRLRADASTSVGESRSLELEDGSRIELNTDSAIRVVMREGERRIELLRGEAWFDVAKDGTRPFYVESGAGWVRVVGTQFSVARRDDETRVRLLRGKVAVNASSHTQAFLEPGQGVEYHNGVLTPVHAFDPLQAFAWRQRQLVFRQQPLAEVVAELNRYWPGHIFLHGDQLERKVVSSVFELDKPQAVLKALEATLDLHAEHYTPYVWVISERSPDA